MALKPSNITNLEQLALKGLSLITKNYLNAAYHFKMLNIEVDV